MSSADVQVADIVRDLRLANLGKVFFILDSDHTKKHVLAELN